MNYKARFKTCLEWQFSRHRITGYIFPVSWTVIYEVGQDLLSGILGLIYVLFKIVEWPFRVPLTLFFCLFYARSANAEYLKQMRGVINHDKLQNP